MRFLAIPVFAALLTVGSALAPAAEPKRWALCVGVDDYVGFIDLRYCGRDASALADSLKTSGFEDRQIVVMHDTAVDARYRPTKRNVEKELDLLLTLAGPDDLVVVSFSGHGIHIDGRSYLCPNEADDSDPTATMLSVDDLYRKLDKCPAALKLLVVDACRNDPRPPGKKSATPDADLSKLGAAFEKPPQGIIVLASCAPGQISWEDEDLKHGVFMHHVLRGLSGEADGNKNGRVTLGELYDFASSETKLHVARRFRGLQVPAQRGEINGVFELPKGAPRKSVANSIGMKFALIPAGEFLMGSAVDEADIFNKETPQHRVRITKPYYLGVHEVTRGQFAQYVRSEDYRPVEERHDEGGWGYDATKNFFEGRRPQFSWRNTGWPATDDHPVVNISWNEAMAFCEWLSKKEGKRYRLPTEAEWEYACRAGTTTKWSHGDDPESVAIVGNTADGSFKQKQFGGATWGIKAADGYAFSSPVGRFPPNKFGLHDMHGNVWEWCSDWFAENTYHTSSIDPSGPPEGTGRMVRGGSWFHHPEQCRSAFRERYTPTSRYYLVGFRAVLVP